MGVRDEPRLLPIIFVDCVGHEKAKNYGIAKERLGPTRCGCTWRRCGRMTSRTSEWAAIGSCSTAPSNWATASTPFSGSVKIDVDRSPGEYFRYGRIATTLGKRRRAVEAVELFFRQP